MPSSISDQAVRRHRVIPEMQPEMAKAVLRKAEHDAMWKAVGQCLLRATPKAWTLDNLADKLRRDPRQVQRWIDGKEQTQVATVFAVEELRKPFVVELAKLAECEIETTVRIKVGV